MNGRALSPFIKWVGGKRQLLPSLVSYLPESYNHYYEPFVGGGALFLRLAPKVASINDFNEELTNTWQVVKNNLDGLKQTLQVHQANDSKEYYLNIRSADRDERLVKMTNTQRAARFIYLNKAGYNGLWRVNSHGQNNVPYGSHKNLNLLSESLDTVSQYLNDNSITITTGDYQSAVQNAVQNDLVYFDPPYVPVNLTSSFTTYTKTGFGEVQQRQLRDLALTLAKRGVKVMLSNSDTELVHQLYADPVFKLHQVQAKRFVNSNAKKRGNVGELIITTY
ncbi:DNA methyltransferase [Lentilactobacillus parabuchneri]|nr:DNA methyltransferase [Lentilactobacillus parabuchneri]OCB81168.1 DNA methyltransferase [Lentilactobacillus parabuchneri]OCB83533.1 DNA methyltransferase [Lentilactobacillus parabuchneri]